jgi:predicted NUDIX family phosphoesterase/dephospho-CoA kinase
MKAKISVDIRRKGASSRFVRTAPNTFYLRQLVTEETRIYAATPQAPLGSRELVVTLPESLLERLGRFQGISRQTELYFRNVLRHENSLLIPRIEAEQSERYKQLLTYIMVVQGDMLLSFRRGSFNRVEDYLRGSLCIGFGGHISQIDLNLFNSADYRQLILDNAARELSEELQLPASELEKLSLRKGLEIVGLLNDDSSPTGRKHFAVVLRYRLDPRPIWVQPTRGEKSITQLQWLDLTALSSQLREFEYWSQLCLSAFYARTVRTQPSFLIRRRAPFKRKHLLVLVGGIGSGKSAATSVLTTDFGYQEVNSGRVLAKLLAIPPIPRTSRDKFQEQAWRFISTKTGPKRFATALLESASRVDDVALIDGIRQKATLDELRRLSTTPLAIVFVYTPPHIAFQFYSGREDQAMTIHDFLRLYDAPVEAEVKKMLSSADAVLYNWTGKVQYERVVRQMMRELAR